MPFMASAVRSRTRCIDQLLHLSTMLIQKGCDMRQHKIVASERGDMSTIRKRKERCALDRVGTFAYSGQAGVSLSNKKQARHGHCREHIGEICPVLRRYQQGLKIVRLMARQHGWGHV